MEEYEWISKFMTIVDTAGISEFIKRSHAVAFIDAGHTPQKAFDMIHLLIFDTSTGEVDAIYPVGKRDKFSRLSSLKNYSERLATNKDLADNPNHIYKKNMRPRNQSGDTQQSMFDPCEMKSKANCRTSLFGGLDG